MRRMPSVVLAAGLGLGLAVAPVLAHHSFSAQFDRNKPVTLMGAVTKVEWINPHARFFIEVKDAPNVGNWEIELGASTILMRLGWTRNSLKVGETVTVEGSRAKNGSKVANATNVKLANGERILAGSSGGDGAGTPARQP